MDVEVLILFSRLLRGSLTSTYNTMIILELMYFKALLWP